MRRFQQVVIAAAVAAGGLSAMGAGTAAADTDSGPQVLDVYRPYQECSPQTVSENDVPIGVLGLGQTLDTTCGQYNTAFTG
ncbi:hypothetical protein ACIRP7_09945 [Streptomyces sp. NPDC102270]|uniref:hypothetical protein n=1 Tax=Streptomyces sp. NPDC102270 TaxID=3366150 RepID=UPI0037FC4200